MATAPTVELLWWEGCPSWEQALDQLREQMAELGLDPGGVEVIQVETVEDAERAAFVGSPTIRIDGADVQPPGEQPVGLTCRVYRLRDGRISALPDPAEVREALALAIEAREGGSDG